MRWNIKTNENIDAPKVDAFLAEVHALCKKHGYYIEHEDTQGGFVIEKYDSDKDFEWLNAASVGATVDSP